jgi:hypothetical protein
MTNDMGNIDQRLAEIERTQERVLVLLESLTKQVGEQATADREWRARHDLMVSGDGNGNPGLRLRVDRLEQSAERAKWTVRAVATAVIGLAAKAVLGLFAQK